jgi:hypothetical protein
MYGPIGKEYLPSTHQFGNTFMLLTGRSLHTREAPRLTTQKIVAFDHILAKSLLQLVATCIISLFIYVARASQMKSDFRVNQITSNSWLGFRLITSLEHMRIAISRGRDEMLKPTHKFDLSTL